MLALFPFGSGNDDMGSGVWDGYLMTALQRRPWVGVQWDFFYLSSFGSFFLSHISLSHPLTASFPSSIQHLIASSMTLIAAGFSYFPFSTYH